MKRSILFLLPLLAGCLDPMTLTPTTPWALVEHPLASGQAYAPHTAVVALPELPDRCYAHVMRTLGAMQTQIQTSDATVRQVSGILKGVVQLTIVVEGDPAGCVVTVHGSVLPNKLVRGEFTEVEEFVTALRKDPRHVQR